MKTKVLAIALFVAASCTAFAQQDNTKQCCQKDKQEQCGKCKKAEGCQGDKQDCPGKPGEGQPGCPGEGPQAGCPGQQPGCPMMAALESVNLTDAQRTAIQDLGKQRAEADKEKCDQKCKERAEADSVARAAQRQEKLNFLNNLKSILTADQYVSFLENALVNAQEAPRGGQPGMEPGQLGGMERGPRMDGPRGAGKLRPREGMSQFKPADDQAQADCCKTDSSKDSKKKSKKK